MRALSGRPKGRWRLWAALLLCSMLPLAAFAESLTGGPSRASGSPLQFALRGQPSMMSTAAPAVNPFVTALLAPDTYLHLLGGAMSGFLAVSAVTQLYGASTIKQYPLLLPAIGLSTALTAGIAKETLDSTGFGDPQWSDIIHTIIGGVLAAGAIAAVELSSGGSSAQPRNDAALFAATGLSLALPIAGAFADEIGLYLNRRRSGK